ncbi:hypothetical protein [Cryptosporangium aurantiacum]|uniref:Uncharacterized protein n=1 Tax=Cryptosporangium aurantiacum TaxID=134849 RepID=A0A1M7RM79_9ACTN|nr:hypothetical protein [Cryptosporangium aurantiacum]SHN47198.1 hypothetical protein SAMN05443668_12146 [Cryptosporangium aurantiacum]
MDGLAEIGAWVVVVALVGVGAVFAVRDERRARARRRSQVAGKEIVYGRGGSYRPRAGLWAGLLLTWMAVGVAVPMLFVPDLPPLWGAAATAAAVVAALYFLLGYAFTTVVEGRVLERKILYSGENDDIKNYWIAVDDGRRTRIAGTPVKRDDYARVVAGALVRLHLTTRGRQVKRLDVLELPSSVNTAAPALDRWVTPAHAARALGSPVEVVPLVIDTPNTRGYVYVPPGVEVVNGTAWPPALYVTEAFDPAAAAEIARRATEGCRRTWHHGDKGVFQFGMTYVLTWGNGALVLRGHVDVNEVGPVSRLAHTLEPPRPDRR